MAKGIATIVAMCFLVIGYMPCANASVVTEFRAGGYYGNVTIPTMYDPVSVSYNGTYSAGYGNSSGLNGDAHSFFVDGSPRPSVGFGEASFAFSDDVTSVRLSFDYVLSNYVGTGQIGWYVNSVDPSDPNINNWYITAETMWGETISGEFDHIFTKGSNPLWVNLYAQGYALYTYDEQGHFVLGNGSATISNLRVEANPAAVPIPGAVWLLGSGLIGLVGLRRRSGK